MITITAGKKYKLKKDFYVEASPLEYSARKGEILTANYPSLGYAHFIGENPNRGILMSRKEAQEYLEEE